MDKVHSILNEQPFKSKLNFKEQIEEIKISRSAELQLLFG